jgi:prophage regulatory protein
MTLRLLKLQAVMDRTALRTTAVYRDIKAGKFVPPIKMARSSYWVEHEVDAILRARVAGATDDQLRALVAELIAQRQQPQRAA